MYGIGKAAEITAKTDPEKAAAIIRAYETDFLRLWAKDEAGVRDALSSILSRLANLGVIGREVLRRFGIELPRLDALRSNSKRLIGTELRELAPAIASIETDPELSRFIYPAAILFGSRLKRYAKRNADLDVAVFVRENVSLGDRAKVQRALSRIFSNKGIDGKVVEFWLAEKAGEFFIRDFPDPDVLLADSTWIHVLLGGVWFGKREVLREIYAKLLPGFIFSEGKTIEGGDARTAWLGGMEREVLQYRLMHKGYRRLYPEQGGIRGSRAEGLDPQSAFWDSGYRRVATKLFVSRVFLPQLKKSKQ
jgi:hypothetical protein